MPNYSCHIPECETAIIDKAIADSPEKERSPWIKECMRQRLEREGYLPGTPAHNIRAAFEAALTVAMSDGTDPQKLKELEQALIDFNARVASAAA